MSKRWCVCSLTLVVCLSLGCSDDLDATDSDVTASDAGEVFGADATTDAGHPGDVTADTFADADADDPPSCPAPSPPPQTGTHPGPCRIETDLVDVAEFGRVETFEYDSQGRLVRHELDGDLTSRHIPDDEPEETTTYTYASDGRLVERREEFRVHANKSVWELVYDETGFLLEEQETQVSQESSFDGRLYVYDADACQRRARREIYPPEWWREPQQASVTTYHYDASGRLSIVRGYAMGEAPEDDGSPNAEFEMEYDAQNRVIRRVERHPGEPERTVTREYEYEGARLVKTSEYRGEPKSLQVYRTHKYDAEGNLIGTDTYAADDTHSTSTTIAYDCW